VIESIKAGDFELLMFVFKKDPDAPHEKLRQNYYPVHLACEYGRMEILRYLIEVEKVDANSIC